MKPLDNFVYYWAVEGEGAAKITLENIAKPNEVSLE